MKKLFKNFTICAVAAVCVCSFSGCHRIAGNDIDYGRLQRSDDENGFFAAFYSYYSYGYIIDTVDMTYSETDEGAESTYGREVVVSGGTAPCYIIDCAEGYENLATYLENREIEGNDSSVVDCLGWLEGGIVYGICNVYKDTVGYLSGGGNYGVEEIYKAEIFSYDAQNDSFEILYSFDGAMAVAYTNGTVIYHKNKKFYACNCADGMETYLVDNKGYDSGFTRYSYAQISFDDKYALFEFKKGTMTTNTYYKYLYNFESGEFNELTLA